MKKQIGHIGLIGAHDTGTSVIQALEEKGIEVTVIDQQDSGSTFMLNGVKYAPLEDKVEQYRKKSSTFSSLLTAAAMFYAPFMDELYGYGESTYKRRLPEGTDIVKEYGLIQNKQSKLSKWEREKVIRIFEDNFERI